MDLTQALAQAWSRRWGQYVDIVTSSSSRATDEAVNATTQRVIHLSALLPATHMSPSAPLTSHTSPDADVRSGEGGAVGFDEGLAEPGSMKRCSPASSSGFPCRSGVRLSSTKPDVLPSSR